VTSDISFVGINTPNYYMNVDRGILSSDRIFVYWYAIVKGTHRSGVGAAVVSKSEKV